MGVNHSVQGTETVALLCALAAATGNIGRPGAAPFSITGQCNAMGTRETGFTASMPGYRPYDDPAARAELAALWNIPESALPAARGKAYPDIINAVVAGRIKGLWIIGTNPIVSFPNRETLEYGLDNLELLVVQDGFETPTTARAHVVLPAAIWGEKDGTFTNSERRVSRVRAAVEPPGDAQPDFDIFLAVADRLGVTGHGSTRTGRPPPTPSTNGARSPPAASATTAASPTNASTPAAASSGPPLPTTTRSPWPAPPASTPMANFPTRQGRSASRSWSASHCGNPPTATSPSSSTPAERSSTGTPAQRRDGSPYSKAWLRKPGWRSTPLTPTNLKIRTGDVVRVVSPRGAVDRVTARVTEIVRAGEVFIPFHYDEACANRLTNDEFDPISREPNYKQCAVRLERMLQ